MGQRLTGRADLAHVPPDVGTCEFNGGVNGSRLSDAEWTQQIITNGTSLNNAYKAKLDTAVPYLQQLKDAGVPVLFRPLHEMNEGWAWWGGRSGANGSARLYQITHDYLLSKGLTNLIWVWNVKDNGRLGLGGGLLPRRRLRRRGHPRPVGARLPAVRLVPGDRQRVPRQADRARRGRQRTVAGAAGGAAAVGVLHDLVGISHLVPTATRRSRRRSATRAPSTRASSASRSGPGPAIGAITGVGGKCVDVAAASTANGTAVQLYDCNGSAAQQWTVSGDGTIRALGKCLDVTGQGTANGHEIQILGLQRLAGAAVGRGGRRPPA